jgi:RNA polymerase sigma-70 factor (ECF subfamily)
LRQHHVDGLTLDELAGVYRIHRATLARRLAAAREKLAAHTRRILLQRFGLGRKELDSLMVLVRSHLDVSMRTLLKESPL